MLVDQDRRATPNEMSSLPLAERCNIDNEAKIQAGHHARPAVSCSDWLDVFVIYRKTLNEPFDRCGKRVCPGLVV
jgi:hypothetical protein